MHPAFQPRLRRESRPPPLTMLAPLGLVVVLCAATQVAVGISYLVNTQHVRNLADGVVRQTGVTSDQFADALHRHHVIFWAHAIAAGALLVLTMAWAWVAQRNANRLEPGKTKSPWSVLGWVLPVSNLVVPPRMLVRIRSAQLFAFRSSIARHAGYELIAVWWLLQLAAEGIGAYIPIGQPAGLTSGSSGDMYRFLKLDVAFSIIASAGVLAFVGIVVLVTLTNDKLRRLRDTEEVNLPLASVTSIGAHPGSVSTYPSSIFPVAVHPSDPRWKPTPPPDGAPHQEPRKYWT